MLYAIINALFYIITFFIVWKKKKKLDIGVTLIFIYTLVACTCVVTYSMKIQVFKLTLWPFIYVFICFLLASKPILFTDYKLVDFRVKNLKLLYSFMAIMFFVGVINIFYSLSSPITFMAEDEILDMYQNKSILDTSVDRLDWFCKNMLGYFSIPFSIVLFYLTSIVYKKKSFYILLVIFVVVFFSDFLMSAMRVLRYNILRDTVSLVSGYLIFYKKISKENKKRINILILIGGLIALSFFIFVTISRHSIAGSAYGGDANAAFIYYLGHSMLVFNYGIVDTIKQFADGHFALGLPFPNLGTHSEGDFPTFVGNMYIDFGFLLTLLLSFFAGLLFSKKKSINCIADAYLVSFYYIFIFMGVFSENIGYLISFLVSFIIFILLKILF